MDINTYFNKRPSRKDKQLLMAAISLLKTHKLFKGQDAQVIFDNLMTRLEMAKNALRNGRGPTKEEMALVK